ncbi:MAG: hypothetical protein IPO62_16420 [Saprospiraceae bacterium]|nr:hypothetical protein [Saprospiraceae bacterium]MBK9632612.1 hypothetical protein [Saprospiraceae bacterium]
MAYSKNPKFRTHAESQLNTLLVSYLEHSDLDTSDRIPGLLIAKSHDFKITAYTWQFESKNRIWLYGGIIKFANGRFVELVSEQRDYTKIRRDHISSSNWYGALIYNIVPRTFGKSNNQYVFFAFSQNQRREKFKIIDGFIFEKDELKFGLPHLKLKDERLEDYDAQRQVVRYSEEASCAISYDDMDHQIVYDHITRFDDPRSVTGPLFVPDGTYEALEYKNHKWIHQVKLDNTILNEAPREKPILDQRPKDILGREK